MSLTNDCLTNVIGLSRNECECFDVPTNESDSDLYLDELEGLNLLQINAGADCGNGTLWDMMQKARNAGIDAYKADLAARLLQTYKESRSPFKGLIGRTENKDNATPGTVAGLQMLCAPVKNGAIILTRIGLIFGSTGTMDVAIYNNIDSEPVHVFTNLETQAGQVKWNSIDKTVLPMYTTEHTHLIYYVVYTYTGNTPKKNQIQCVTCSGRLLVGYNHSAPSFFYNSSDSRYTWYKWLNVTGITGDSIDAIKDKVFGFNNVAYGIVLDGEVKCSMMDIACNDTDYQRSGVAIAMAWAIRYRAGEFLCNAILSSGQLNRYTMLEREALYGKRNQYRKEYSDRLDWIVENMNWADSGCMECNPKMRRGSLLSR